jgi:radical SAM superfamily enzyme YgiQ (UPF0313 family)
MESYQFGGFSIILDKEGDRNYSKVSYPIRYGRFAEIKTSDVILQFSLNGEIKYIQGRPPRWPHPGEWLKRTVGNDWIYYSAGDYKDVYDLFGEYYFPCLPYPSNSLLGGNPFNDPAVESAMRSWQKSERVIKGLILRDIPHSLRDFLIRVAENDAKTLVLRSRELYRFIGGQVTVLPPDTRHVDYEVIPVVVADGCLYHCGFCRVKTGQDYLPRTRENILDQIKNLKRFYARDLPNYNAIFLGQHDALRAGQGLLEFAAINAYELFEFERSYMKESRLFLFGSADSMIHSEEALFESLNSLPFSTYLNIGLESADPATLAALKKPVGVETVRDAFARMLDVNRRYERIEVTANFVLGEDLPPSHLTSFLELTQNGLDRFYNKGSIYLSPLMNGEVQDGGRRRELLRRFNKVKMHSRLPTFLYLIQRL